jgi:hypothetical protein
VGWHRAALFALAAASLSNSDRRAVSGSSRQGLEVFGGVFLSSSG